jgi:3-methylcrotonyl-CoA carboxylase alpha subunit
VLNRVLIANRGEIAVRIARTCRRMGVGTVAVFSDVDADAAHVAACDRAFRIGPAPAAESYLRGDAIVAAALAAGADSVHPGYGFLSENAAFAQAVLDAGLTWIGPPPEAIRAMGLKDAAKARMAAAGVPVTPGYHGAEQDPRFLAGAAAEIGYPVLIKARAGGGGKGMRRVDRPDDFAEALESAAREAASSFGDGAVLIERYLPTPRHIEVQVFCDAHGGAIHLFERDCSLQRRHQKVIEEAPAPGLSGAMRDAMGAAAVRAAQAVGYVGAGTVEFIADASDGLHEDRFYFMEMNTRLQVEHPVTEAVTGVDLVEWQLRVAAGESLPLAQGALNLRGWAVEARLYAEDPAMDFRPSTGRLNRLRLPADVRVDAGVREGDAVSPFYDPMIAKLIAHGASRGEALARLRAALSRVEVAGVAANAGFLARLLADPEVAAGRVDTGLIARRGEALTADPTPEALDWALAGAAALGLADDPGPDPWDARDGWRPWGSGSAVACFDRGEARFLFARGRMEIDTPAGAITATTICAGSDSIALDMWDERCEVAVAHDPRGAVVFREGRTHVFRAVDPLALAADGDGPGGDIVRAPMPGVVRAIHVETGAVVAAGDRLATIEAMKMEHALRAPRGGVVAEVAASPGDQVAEGALLVALEPE